MKATKSLAAAALWLVPSLACAEMPASMPGEETKTGTGISGPLPLAASSMFTADSLNASQPRPATVSVGSTKSLPPLTAAPASSPDRDTGAPSSVPPSSGCW